MRQIIFFFSYFFIAISAFSQNDERSYFNEYQNLPFLDTRITIPGNKYFERLSVSKDSVSNGFTLITRTSGARVKSFIIAYSCDACDLFTKLIYGNKVTNQNFPFLRSMGKNKEIGFDGIIVEYEQKLYKAPPFLIYTTE